MTTTAQNIGKTEPHETRADAPPGLGEDIKQHFPLVWSIARSFAREKRETHRDDSDAFAEGLLHLLKALETYDPKHGASLQTWIGINVKHGINTWRKLRCSSVNDHIEFAENIEAKHCETTNYDDLEKLACSVDLFPQEKLRSILSQRIDGKTWREIGDSLKCSKQAAEQLFTLRILPVLRMHFLA
jgi:RNA polymerase sigma factor (sigma-70 family)